MKTRYQRKRSFNGDNDRISSLPDSLLIHVLSFLPTKQVVRASVLSKRWSRLWTIVPVIDVEISQDEPRELAILDKYIALNASPKMDKLHISVGHSRIGEGLSTRLDSVVRSAVARHVEDLALCFSSETGYALPWEVYTCGSLRVLEVTGCWFSPGERALETWRTLRVLDVADATWSDEMVARVVGRLPGLESLRLRRFRGVTRVDVSSPDTKLKELVMENCLDTLERGVELCICAPHLQELKLLGEWRSLRPRLVNVPSLVSVEFCLKMRDFDEVRDVNTVRKLFEMVQLCQQLKIGLWCLQVLGLININFLCASFSGLKCLSVDTDIELDQYLPALRNLFRCSPNLEILIISFNDSHGKIRDSPGSISLEPLGCLLPKVKIVELHWLGEIWFDLAKCLLKNMVTLEKMVIYQHPFIRILRLLELAKDLLALPRSSPSAVVIIH